MPVPFLEDTVLAIDKPYTWTSYNVVKKIQVLLKHHFRGEKVKIGHAGTLDPLATGVLVVCIGKATKRIEEIQNFEKEYIARVTFGKTTPSYDLETPFNGDFPVDHINSQEIKKVLAAMTGVQQQIPPVYSAIRIDGHRAYKTAHQGGTMEMPARTIEIFNIELLDFEQNTASIQIVCSKGTYIRTIAHDIGKKLNSGAYLSGLCRNRVGPYHINSAINIGNFENFLHSI